MKSGLSEDTNNDLTKKELLEDKLSHLDRK